VAKRSFEKSTPLHHTETFSTVRQGCELGDEWHHKYPVPLSSYPKYSIKTGNADYDSIMNDLAPIGFRALQIVAKGRSSTIVLAQNLTNSVVNGEQECVPVALKLNTGQSVQKSRSSWRNNMGEEIRIMKTINHPYIVTWLHNINYRNRVGIVLEFCENGNLEQLLRLQNARFLTEPVTHKYFRCIFSGLEYLHNQGIAHRDICTQNMLISQYNTIKITDFGHAVRYMTGDAFRQDDCGTTGYQAPEVILKIPYNPKLIDLWSLGCVLYVMSTGRFPFGLIRSEIVTNSTREVVFPKSHVLPLSAELNEILRGILKYIPDYRFSLNRISHCQWFRAIQDKVQIGNFHLVRQPQKIREGRQEQKLKALYEI